MRAVFYSVKGTGHVNPTLPLVRSLLAAGDDVTYVLTPEWQERIEALGARYLNTGEGARFTTADYNPTKPFPLQLIPATAAILPRLVEQARSLAPDVVVYDSCALWGRAVGHVLGVPAVCSLSTLVLGDGEHIFAGIPDMPDIAVDDANERAIAELRTRWGFETSVDEIGRFYAAENLVYSCEALNPFHTALRRRFHFIGPLLSPVGSPRPDIESRRRIYVAMGTVAAEYLGLTASFFRPFLDALGGDDRYDVVVSVGKTIPLDELGDVPNNVSVHASVPQIEVLEHADLFVTHAGANSMHEGLFFGVPLVCIPCFGDQLVNARRVSEAGAGVTLPIPELSAARLRAEVERVLGDASYREAAARLRSALRATAGAKLAREILRAAATGRPRTS